MQKRRKVPVLMSFALVVVGSILVLLLQPLHTVGQVPPYSEKKNVFIIADSKVTEMFDMLAPFYLFNQTGKLNVLIVAKDKTPVRIKRNLFLLPHYSFREVDSMHLKPDVIVIPALSHIDNKQDPVVIDFIKTHYTAMTKVLAVCDGASTAAATGIFDGKPITCHASDFKIVKSHFPKPAWVRQVTVAHQDNLYSTAGVSNAVEGALSVIRDLYGDQTMHAAAANIHYPHPDILTEHQSISVNLGAGVSIVHKMLFRKRRKLGMLLQDNVNEFEMVSVLDTYSRTFPKSFTCFTTTDSVVHTRYGLSLIVTGARPATDLSELHLLSNCHQATIGYQFKKAEIIQYDDTQYPIDGCLDRIGFLYGTKFKKVVKLMLDYN